MKKFALSILVLTLAGMIAPGIAQDRSVLNETFVANDNQWTEKDDDKAYAGITGGKYQMSHRRATGSYLFFSDGFELDQNQNFEISTDLVQVMGAGADGYGLVWGAKDAGSFYAFNVNGNGQYRIYKYKDHNFSELKAFTQTDSYVSPRGKKNKLSIRRIGELLSFYANDHFLYSMPFQEFFGNKAGYVLYNEMEVHADNLIARQGQGMPEIFEDALEDNRNAWIETQEDSSYCVFARGKLVMRGLEGKKAVFKLHTQPIDTEKDFEIEANLRQIAGRKDKGYGMMWGASDQDNGFMFLVNSFGSYSIWKRLQGASTKLVDWTPSDQMLHLRVQPNKLVVRKAGKQLSFYLNDIWLTDLPFDNFAGQQLGFVLQADLRIEAEYLAVREGKTSYTPKAPVITLLAPTGNDITIDSKSLNFQAGIQSDTKLTGIKLIVNGEQIPMKAKRDESGEYALMIDQELDLRESSNEIKLMAKNADGMIQRLTTAVTVKSPSAPVTRNGNDYALFFAIDEYEYWSDLTNPVNDVRTIAQELETNFGFNTELVIGEDRKGILKKLKEYARRKYNDGDQLLIFFAGHGKFDEYFGEGYVVCQTSAKDDEGNDSYISHSSLRTIVNNIPAKHVFLCMDVCFGGTIDPFIAASGSRGGGGNFKEMTQTEFIDRKLKFKTRKYLTSGGKEYVPDGTPGQHSPFARKFLEGLRNYGGHDRIITLGELTLYFERLLPEPRFGEFGSNEPGSDFLFIAR